MQVIPFLTSTSILLCASPDVQMRVRRSGPHDLGAGRLVHGRESGSFRIEWPHDYPVRTYLDGHARGVIWIRIAALSGTGQHVVDAGGAPHNEASKQGYSSRLV
jgi:hypothetical protein